MCTISFYVHLPAKDEGMKTPSLSAHDVRRLAVEAHRDPRTVRSWYRDRESVRPMVDASLTVAATRLGIALPLSSNSPSVPPAAA